MPNDVAKLRRVCKADVEFMRSHGIMDYSLLLSAEKLTKSFYQRRTDKGDVDVRVSTLEDPLIIEPAGQQ